MNKSNSNSKGQKSSKLNIVTPDFNSMIRITFWNGLGFIFLMFINSYVVIYFFGGSGIDLGIIMALQPLARLFSMPLIAYLTDRSSKKLLVFIGSIGRTIAYVFYWFSLVVHNLYLFGLGTFLQGLLVGFFWPPFFSLISEKSFKANRTQALASGRGKMIGYGFLMGAFISIPIFALVSTFMPDNIPLMYSPLLIFAIINLFAGYRFYLKVDESLTYESYCASLEDDILILNNNKDFIDVNDDKTEPKIEIIESKENNVRQSQRMFFIGFSSLILAILITSSTGTIYTPFISAFLIESLLPGFSKSVIPI
ncbi:MAG: MFS transporter, partial [Candidatus Lokiarchaeota archaeon]|nr:MFS transporter [Candidatus Lokiarchaeota archaeon]